MKELIILHLILSALIPIITGFVIDLFTGFVVGMICVLGSSFTLLYTTKGVKIG